MRRGHPRVWRNEGPRHFHQRPRLGPPGFGPPRNYIPQPYDSPSFPGPQRFSRPFLRGPPPKPHLDEDIQGPPYTRRPENVFSRRPNEGPGPFNRRTSQDIPPQYDRRPSEDSPHYTRRPFRNNQHNRLERPEPQEPYNNDRYSINNMGDVDHRNYPPKEDNFPVHNINPWVQDTPMRPNDVPMHFEDRDDRRHRFEEPPHEMNRFTEYTGHRPPASDHYEGQTAANVEISESFSRSVDDTVDIVRRKLMHRSDPQNYPIANITDVTDSAVEPEHYPELDREAEIIKSKRTANKPKRNMKSDCDKIKNKIVHQLFKMDKDRIHKLMDNPSSSNKFEFAIKSLITESQNSMNRHLRSAAEKSLYGGNAVNQYNHENDAIYEDTFMRQLAGILDPQDTIILEDIKPIVLAELNKVLHLNDFESSSGSEFYYNEYREHGHDAYAEHFETNSQQPPLNYKDEPPFHDLNQFDTSQQDLSHTYDSLSPENQSFNSKSQDSQESVDQNYFPSDKLMSKERETYLKKKNESYEDITPSTSSFSVRPNAESEVNTPVETDREEEPVDNSNDTAPCFNVNAPLSDDDEYTFAELDKQYHVAVYRNYLTDDVEPKTTSSNLDKEPRPTTPQAEPISSKTTDTPKREIKPVALSALQSAKYVEKDIKKDLLKETFETPKDTQIEKKFKRSYEDLPKPDSSSNDSLEKSRPRKRSSDKSTSHRKEKRKRSESPSDVNKKILNKNIIINLTDCTKKSENCESSGKSVFNLFFSKDQRNGDNKEGKKSEKSESKHSDKHDKNKDKTPSKDTKKSRKTSTSSNHSIISPNHKDSRSTTSSAAANKNKFTSIDIFSKGTPTSTSTVKTVPPKSISKQVTRRHVATQCVSKGHSKETQTSISKSCTSRFCQTERLGVSVKFVQTDPVSFTKSTTKSTDAFERMKEIDIEIQELVQEKFKLYNSLESKESNNMDLGMTVLNMPAGEVNVKQEGSASEASVKLEGSNIEDSIVEDFANIPSEELEEIALESVTHKRAQSKERRSVSKSKTVTKPQKKPVKKTPARKPMSINDKPNISLLEMIMDDERPLEEIISLDDYEVSPKTRTKKNIKTKKRTKSNSSPGTNRPHTKHARVDRQKSIPKEILTDADQLRLYNIKPCSVVILRANLDQYKYNTIGPDTRETENKEPDSIPESTNASPRKGHPKLRGSHRHRTSNRKRAASVTKLKEITEEKAAPTEGKGETQQPETIVSEEVVEQITEEAVINEKHRTPKRTRASSVTKLKEITKEKKAPSEGKGKGKKGKAHQPEAIVSEEVAEQIIEEAVINEIHFQDTQIDMLDVSEDIVISEVVGENLAKVEAALQTIDEVVVDNSQSEDDNPPEDEGPQAVTPCKMYDFSADEDLKHESIALQGNGDAILAIECIENNFLASCLNGNVYYYSSEGKLLNTLRGSNFAVTCLTIVKEDYGTTVFTGSLDSRIRSYDLETYAERGPECNVLSPIQSMDCAWGTVFVGTRTGFVLQFECKNHMLIPVSTIKFSEQSILALRALKEGPRKVLLVAPRSENVTIKDAQTGLLLRSLIGPKMTVYTLLYESGKVFCGTSSNQIQIFDYASGSHMGEHEGGKGAVCLRAAGGLVFAGCYDGCVYVFRPGEGKPFAQLRGPTMLLLSLAVVGGKIIVGYKDRSLYIWKIPQNILAEMIL